MNLDRAARWLIRRWIWLVGAVLVLAALATWQASRLELDLSFRHFFLDQAEDPLAAEMRERFGDNAGSYLVAVIQGPDVLRADVVAAVAEISDAVAAIPHVQQVFSLATVPFIRGEEGGLSLEPLAALVEGGGDPETLKRAVVTSPLYERRLVSVDGRTTIVLALLDSGHRTVRARAPSIAAFRTTVESRLPAGYTSLFTGYPITEAEYARLVLRGFAIAQAVGLALMAAALYVTFRTVAAVVLPLVTVGIATLLMLGLMQVTGQQLTFVTASVPLLMLVIGVTEVSFHVARLYEEAATGWDDTTLVRAVASTLWPGFIAACTTSAGFLALGVGRIGMTRDFGLNMSLASLVTFAVSAAVIPGALARLGRPPQRGIRALQGGPITRLLERAANAALTRRRLIVVVTAALVALGCAGLFRITLAQYATQELPPDHPMFVAQRIVDAEVSGAFQVHVVVRAPDGGVLTTPARLRDIEQLQTFLGRQPGVVKAWSVVDYLKELQLAMGGDRGNVRSLPARADLIAQYLLVLASAGSTSDLPTLIDPTHRFAVIVLGTTDFGTDGVRGLRAAAETFIGTALHGTLEIRLVGDNWEVTRGVAVLARDQLRMTLSSLAFIFPLVAVFLRSWKLTLLCLPPNLVPLLAALGLMGFAGFQLRVGTSIVLPVSLGIAVDMTTHYIARAREEWMRDGHYEGAVRRALTGTGWSMVSSTMALVLGFCAFQIPEFRSFKDVGVLASATMVVALGANLFLVPALILWARPFGEGRAPDRRCSGSGSASEGRG